MTRLFARVLAIALAGTLVLSCTSSPSTEACEQAAIDQAFAEQRWQEELEEHVLADEALSDDPDSESALNIHDHSADALFSTRVNMILAEAETRRRCE